MIKVIIFDFDGVIVESVDIKTNAFAKLFEQEGDGIVKEIVNYHLKNSGVSRFEKIKYIYGSILKKELTEDNFGYLCSKFAKLVIDDVVAAPYVEGALEFLNKYANAYKFFIVSATPQAEIIEIVRRRGIMFLFQGIFGAPFIKADILKNIMLENLFLPSECVYIGDAMNDYESAKINSLNFIARVNNNDTVFRDIACKKINNLKGLDKIIGVM